jgi:hypothetical protein
MTLDAEGRGIDVWSERVREWLPSLRDHLAWIDFAPRSILRIRKAGCDGAIDVAEELARVVDGVVTDDASFERHYDGHAAFKPADCRLELEQRLALVFGDDVVIEENEQRRARQAYARDLALDPAGHAEADRSGV